MQGKSQRASGAVRAISVFAQGHPGIEPATVQSPDDCSAYLGRCLRPLEGDLRHALEAGVDEEVPGALAQGQVQL